MFLEDIETVRPKFAISWRNNRLLRESDYVVTYITHTHGGAYQYAEKAKRQKKNVINLGILSKIVYNETKQTAT